MNRNGEEEAPGSYRPPVPSDAWMFPDLNLNPQNQAPVSPGSNSPLHTMESGYTHFDGEDQVKEVSSRVHWDEPSLPADETGSSEPRIRQPQETCAHSIATFDSEVFSHLTDVTDWTKMQDIYKQSSICTEAVEETGVKNPLGFAIVCCAVLVGEMSRGLTFPTLWLYVQSLGGTSVNMGSCRPRPWPAGCSTTWRVHSCGCRAARRRSGPRRSGPRARSGASGRAGGGTGPTGA